MIISPEVELTGGSLDPGGALLWFPADRLLGRILEARLWGWMFKGIFRLIPDV